MKTKTPAPTPTAIWNRLFQPTGEVLSVEAAQSLLGLDFPQEDKDRMSELAAKARDGSLSAAEEVEIRNYEQVGNLLALMQSRARQRLKIAANSNGQVR